MNKEKVKHIKRIAREYAPMYRMRPRIIKSGRKKARVNEKVKIKQLIEEYINEEEN